MMRPIILGFAAVLAPSMAQAHAIVFPAKSTPGAYERYVLRVPNEKKVPTTRIEIRFPEGVRVVSFAKVEGWTLELARDTAEEITSAAWTGTLDPETFVELPFVAVNPATPATLVWPAYQTYADGERVEWAGAADSNLPASRTVIATVSEPTKASVDYISLAALGLSVVSLGVALRAGSAKARQ